MRTNGLCKKTIEFLDDSVLTAYNKSLEYFESLKARTVLSQLKSERGYLVESSPFIIAQLINPIKASGPILSKRIRIANREEIESLPKYADFLKEKYADVGLALVTGRDSYERNDFLAHTLATQLNSLGIPLGNGKLIPYKALKLREDDRSFYGLVFELKTRAKNQILDLDHFNWGNKSTEGLARAMFGLDGQWHANYKDLYASLPSGRIIVLSCIKSKKLEFNDKMKSI